MTRCVKLFIVGLACTAGACATTRTAPRPRPFPQPGGPASTQAAREPRTRGEAIVRTAMGLLGTPYRLGGGDRRGFDCSGLVQYVFGQHGVRLPRQVVDLYRTRLLDDVRQVRAGDLLFFSTTTRRASHVAISLGGRRFVHAPNASGVVRVEDLDVTYWARRLLGVRRLPLD